MKNKPNPERKKQMENKEKIKSTNKQEVRVLLNRLNKSSSCFNEVASRFLEYFCDKYGIDINSIEPEKWQEGHKDDIIKPSWSITFTK
jgi:hypothetical protein